MENNIEQHEKQEQELWDEAEKASRGIIHPHRAGWISGYYEARKKSLSELAAKDAEIASLRAQLSTMHTTEQVREMLGIIWDEARKHSQKYEKLRKTQGPVYAHDEFVKLRQTTINNILNGKQ